MSSEVCLFALRNAVAEIKNVCPSITSTFIFRENGEVIAEDQEASQFVVDNAQEVHRAISEKASCLGGLESVTFKGQQNQVSVTKVDEFCIAYGASNDADERTIIGLTRVLIPTMLKLVQQIYPAASKPSEIPVEVAEAEPTPTLAEPLEPLLPSAPVNQLLVENLRGLGGFLGNSDHIRIESAVLAKWRDVFGDREITEVIIEETSTGKQVRCKYQPIKDAKLEGKGVIQIPDKLLLALGTHKGALVTVKPIVE
jgi:hypothetical protein